MAIREVFTIFTVVCLVRVLLLNNVSPERICYYPLFVCINYSPDYDYFMRKIGLCLGLAMTIMLTDVIKVKQTKKRNRVRLS